MNIAITGPTGNIGHKLVHELLNDGAHNLVLLARSPEKLQPEQSRGAHLIAGDLADSAYFERATEGVDALFAMIPPHFAAEDFRAYQNRIVDAGVHAVRRQEIPHVVLLSSIGGHLKEGTGPILGLHDAEEKYASVAQRLTILRPSYFMENFLMHLDAIQKTGTIFLPVPGEARLPMIATGDIASVAAHRIVEAGSPGVQVVPLHGPRDYSFAEAARILGRSLGAELQHVEVTPEQARESLKGMGASDDASAKMVEMHQAIASGHLQAEHPRSPETTTPTTFEIFVEETVKPLLAGTHAGRS